MGLNLECGDMDVRVGSYGTVGSLKIYLLRTIRSYIVKNEISDTLPAQIDEIVKGGNIDLNKYNKVKHLFREIGGFDCFIDHSDCGGVIRSYQACDFVRTCDKLNDYFDKGNSFFYNEDRFYLYDIFKYSAENDEMIYFT